MRSAADHLTPRARSSQSALPASSNRSMHLHSTQPSQPLRDARSVLDASMHTKHSQWTYSTVLQQQQRRLTATCLPAGEVAIVDGSQLKLLIGSQDATTCVIAILACPVTALVWAAHLDCSTLGQQDVRDLQLALQQMQQPQLFMAGGYCTERGQGPSE